VSEVVDRGFTRHGIVQLRRHWRSPSAIAVVLLVHGIGEHSGRYGRVAAGLNAEGIDVVAIDLPGFGGSGGRRAFVRSFDEYVYDVEDQLGEVRALGLPTVLFGHSMGGLVALVTVLRHRARPDLLVLSGPALAARVPAPLRALAPLGAWLVPSLPVPSPVPATLLATDAAVTRAYLRDPANVRVATPALGAGILRAAAWANDHVAELDVPALVLHGMLDRIVPARATEVLGTLPGVERRVYDGCGHEIHNERAGPDEVRDIAHWIRAGLGRIEPEMLR
jgi:acylglycerol lipase